jgi:hypothetical protein
MGWEGKFRCEFNEWDRYNACEKGEVEYGAEDEYDLREQRHGRDGYKGATPRDGGSKLDNNTVEPQGVAGVMKEQQVGKEIAKRDGGKEIAKRVGGKEISKRGGDFVCRVCSRTFDNKMSLSRHLGHHTRALDQAGEGGAGGSGGTGAGVGAGAGAVARAGARAGAGAGAGAEGEVGRANAPGAAAAAAATAAAVGAVVVVKGEAAGGAAGAESAGGFRTGCWTADERAAFDVAIQQYGTKDMAKVESYIHYSMGHGQGRHTLHSP